MHSPLDRGGVVAKPGLFFFINDMELDSPAEHSIAFDYSQLNKLYSIPKVLLLKKNDILPFI